MDVGEIWDQEAAAACAHRSAPVEEKMLCLLERWSAQNTELIEQIREWRKLANDALSRAAALEGIPPDTVVQ